MDLVSWLAIIFVASAAGAGIYLLKLRDDNEERAISHRNVIEAISYIIAVDDRCDDSLFLLKILQQVETTAQSDRIWLNYSFNPSMELAGNCLSLEREITASDLQRILKRKKPEVVRCDSTQVERIFYLMVPVLHAGSVNLIITLQFDHFPGREEVEMSSALCGALWQSMRKKYRNRRIYERELFLRTATEKGDIGLFDWDIGRNEINYSAVWKSQLGYRVDEVGDSFEEWRGRLHPADLDNAVAQVEASLANPAKPYFLEHRLQHKDGHYVWIRAQAEVHTNAVGEPVRMLGAHIDISAFKRIEIQIKSERDQAHKLARRNDLILDTVSDGIICLDSQGNHTYFNSAAVKMLGFDAADVIGKSYLEVWCSTSGIALPFEFDTQPIESSLRNGEASVCNDWFRTAVGTLIPVQRKTSPLLQDGRVTGVVISFSDINQQIQNERSLKLSAAVFDNTAEGIMITDEDNRIVSVNPAFEQITGYSHEEAIGQNPNILSSGDTRRNTYRQMWDAIARDGAWKGEIINRRKSGEIFTELLSISTLRDDYGASYHVGVLSDISSIKETQERLAELANHDRLTGVPNKFFFENLAGHLLDKDKRLKRKAALLYLDLDRFKNVNDSMGHDYGDELIIECAGRIRSSVREMDYISRIGGDEFAVFVESYEHEDEVYALAQRLINVVSEPYDLKGCTTHIGLSVGIAFYPKDGETIEILKKAADTALYKAKSAGRGVYSAFSPDMSDLAKERQELENLLRKAMQDDVLELHYQPQVSLPSGEVLGYEALARWNDPERGFIPPDKFIPLAEETGLIMDLGRWALDKAASQMRYWQDRGDAPEYVAVNVSAVQMARSDLVKDVTDVIERYGIAPSSLELEITESFLIHDPEEARRVLILLKALGIRISIDDFGTGFSSLGYLKNLPCDCIKIDKSFIAGITDNPEDQSLVRAIIAMSRGLGLEVVAEGVESAQHGVILSEYGCAKAQGWHYGRPALPDLIRPAKDVGVA